MEFGKKGVQIIQSLVVSYIVTGIVLCVLAFIMYQSNAGIKIANLGITLTYIISSVLGGFVVGKKMEKRKFLWGLFVGTLYFVILLIVSIIIHKGGAFLTPGRLTTLLLCMAGGTLGGMIS